MSEWDGTFPTVNTPQTPTQTAGSTVAKNTQRSTGVAK